MPSALEKLLGHAAAARFLKRAWPDDHFLVHRRMRELPAPLRALTFDGLAAAYTGQLQIAGGEGVDHLQFSVSTQNPDYLRRIGLTVFFGDDVSALLSQGPAFLRELERDLGAPPGIGAIRCFSSPQGGGLGAHYDQGETFIVQLSGTKKLWLCRNTTYPAMQFAPGKPPSDEHYAEFARDGFPTREPRKGFTVTMKPGSVLFVPRGMWHRTTAGTASFSASICVDLPNAIDVLLPQLRAALRQDVRFRRPLFEHELGPALKLAARAIEFFDPSLMLDALGEREAASLPIRDGTRFQRVPSTRLALKGRRLKVVTWARGREVTLEVSPRLISAVKQIIPSRAAFTFGELGGTAALRVLLRSLVEFEAVKWLAFPALDV